STRLSVVLTPWPPGPLDRENRHRSSAAGTVTLDEMTRSGTAAGMTTIIPIAGAQPALAEFGPFYRRPISANGLSQGGCMLEPC
ncbi:MAG: hypothetical protein QOC73_981, partial [Actinomycetota bacterium]|nr:hypothetical protein [Actinomycetota bacterium]